MYGFYDYFFPANFATPTTPAAPTWVIDTDKVQIPQVVMPTPNRARPRDRSADVVAIVPPMVPAAVADSTSPPPPPPTTQPPQPLAVAEFNSAVAFTPLGRPNIFCLGVPEFSAMTTRVRAAQAVAALVSEPTMGEESIAVEPRVGFLDRVGYALLGKHKTYHRASNKFQKRIATLRELRELMIFKGIGHKRVRNPLNMAAAEELARRVLSDAEEEGKVGRRELGWYKRALVELYFVKDDDDTFFAQMAVADMRGE
jgi:hypothetical protein